MQDKTKQQLIEEIESLRRELAELEQEKAKRKKGEEALQQSEERYRTLFESKLDGMCVIDETMKLLLANQAAATMFGFDSMEEMYGANPFQYIPLQERERLLAVVTKDMFQDNLQQVNEFQVMKKDGEKIWIDAVGTLTEYQGKPAGLVSFRDITEQKRAEQALRESEQRLGTILHGSPIPTFIIDKDHRVIYWNKALEKHTGVKAEEVTGTDQHWRAFYTEKRPCMADLLVDKAVEEIPQWYPGRCSKSELVEEAYEATDFFPALGEEGEWLRFTAAAIRDSKGNLLGALETLEDITERKKAEEELLRLSNAVKMSTDSIVISDLEGRILEVNEATLRMYGTEDKGDIIGKNSFALIAPEDRERALAGTKEVIEKGYVNNREYHIITKDGSRIPVEMSVSTMKDVDGKAIGFVGISRDITERKRAEEKLRESEGQLRDLAAHLQSVREEERTNIAREMHDELGQALTALKMDLSWLNKKLPRDDRALLDKIKSMSRLTDTTIQTIKRMSMELRPAILDDLGLTAAIEWEAQEFERRAGITCELNIEQDIIVLEQDRSTAIFRIFQETLLNVARHANATMVRVTLKEQAGNITLEIADNGKGITGKQISNPKSFGLIGMRERALFLGGEVHIKGIHNEGTTVTVTIPLRSDNPPLSL